MRDTMFQEHRTLDSAEDFAIYGHGSHLGHVSKTIFTKFAFPLSKRAPYKSNRKAMNRNWSNQKANPALKTKAGNK